MKLFRIISGAQNGRVFANLGALVGLSEETTAKCVECLSKPLVDALGRRTGDREGVIDLLDLFSARRYDRFLTTTQIFGHPRSAAEGQRILDFLIEDRETLEHIITTQQEQFELERTTIDALLPYVAIMVMGAMEHRLREPFKEIVAKLDDAELSAQAAKNPFVTLAELLRSRAGTSSEEPSRKESGEQAESGLQRTSEPGDFLDKLVSQNGSQHAA
ncbi:MAG: DUF937 domain-containing protein [Dichotomicrobium sp.]